MLQTVFQKVPAWAHRVFATWLHRVFAAWARGALVALLYRSVSVCLRVRSDAPVLLRAVLLLPFVSVCLRGRSPVSSRCFRYFYC